MKVQNKTILVTGGGSGMGRELVLHLLSKEAKVIAIDINETGLKETVELASNNKNSLALLLLTSPIKMLLKELSNITLTQFGLLMASLTMPASFSLL
jgi:NAD(P)-dependent dehydrogenase (short-subunit alcohol dehydrogenase family)